MALTQVSFDQGDCHSFLKDQAHYFLGRRNYIYHSVLALWIIAIPLFA